MTLLEVVRTMEAVAANQPSVNMIVQNDVFKLNDCPDARYGVFAWEQQAHTLPTDGDWNTYQFRIFYADRLTKNEDNRLEVQSTAVLTLQNICRTLNDMGLIVGDLSATRFNQRFKDVCAGMYAVVNIQAPVDGNCGEGYRYYEPDTGGDADFSGLDFNIDYNAHPEIGDFPYDFNNDFAVYYWRNRLKCVKVI